MKKSAIIFDMDGTLWDAVDDIVISWNRALEQMGETDTVITKERIVGLMGQTMDKFAAEIFPQYEPEEAMARFHVLEEAENEYLRLNGTQLLGEVDNVFAELHERGFSVCIVSNCQSGYIEAFIEHYHLENLVDDFECYGNTKKGKADNLRTLIARNGFEKYWYLGDTRSDYEACCEADVPFIWAVYGFGERIDGVPHAYSLEGIGDHLPFDGYEDLFELGYRPL